MSASNLEHPKYHQHHPHDEKPSTHEHHLPTSSPRHQIAHHNDNVIQYDVTHNSDVIHNGNDVMHNQVARQLSNGAYKDSFNIDVTQQEDVVAREKLVKACLMMTLWYFCSFMTIFMNKYILSTLDGDPGVLGECQILMTTFFGCIMMYLPCWQGSKPADTAKITRYQFFKTISLLGWMRFGAIVCSVVSLKYVAVSFSETIKSSAPLFTVVIAYFILGEHSGVYVNLSLVPIMLGLALATFHETSFTTTGFIAAVANNVLDCLQNVFSKSLLIGDQKYSPMELQFYTSVAATIVQMPFWFIFLDVHSQLEKVDSHMGSMLLFNSFLFYFQSLSAYLLMSLISPVTFSVAGTVKRVISIWFSVLMFGNSVTLLSGLGTVLVMSGVVSYQRARTIETSAREDEDKSSVA